MINGSEPRVTQVVSIGMKNNFEIARVSHALGLRWASSESSSRHLRPRNSEQSTRYLSGKPKGSDLPRTSK